MDSAMVLNAGIKNHTPNQLTRSIERVLDEAQISGDLKLSGRKLKEFPKSRKEYNLSDTVIADLSKNRFTELPTEVTEFYSLEKCDLYHNVLRTIPDTICKLQSLVYLDLSRNQLQWVPPGLCQLSALQVLLLSNNRLVRLPADIGAMASLAELDLSANQLTLLPASIGNLAKLRSLLVRRNQLSSLPVEMSALRLEILDISANQISSLPNELRVMTSLVELELGQNPLLSPPSSLCARGKVHIFKYLEGIAQRGEGRKSTRTPVDMMDGKSNGRRRQTLPGRVSKTPEPEVYYGPPSRTSPILVSATNATLFQQQHHLLAGHTAVHTLSNGTSISGQSTPSTISPGDPGSLEETLTRLQNNSENVRRPDNLSGLMQNSENHHHNGTQSNISNPMLSPLNSTLSPSTENITEDRKGPLEHIQTYREYKEALRLQRWQPTDIYRQRGNEQANTPTTPSDNAPRDHCSMQEGRQYSEHQTNGSEERKFDPKMEAVISYVKSQLPNGHSPIKNGGTNEPSLVTTSLGYVNNNTSKSLGGPKSGKQPGKLSPSRTLSFTMRREHEKAKEEAHLIAQLRQSLESRLKMTLPPHELASALQDGVVLCHLANHVRPRSVASVHVPSPAVPKLTMARCRKNVDNFLAACRKIGVPEESIKSLSESFEQSESTLGGVNQLCNEKHCENLIQVILQLLDLADNYCGHYTPNYIPEMIESGPLSTFLCLLLFFGSVLILYLMPESL